MFYLVLLFLQFALVVIPVLASAGDRDPLFHHCVNVCLKEPCKEFFFHHFIIDWGCKGNCKYDCMFLITEQRLENDQEVLQYNGKWPFYRLFGIQEPASFLFSLMNLCSQICGWLVYRKYVLKEYEFYTLNKVQFLINSFAWICATIFHARDTYWTEKMDYFSAALVIGISVFTCFTQIIGRLRDFRSYLVGVVLSFLFGAHIFYMAFIHFDYGYNMKFLVANGVVNIVLWLIWCLKNRRKKPFVWKCVLSMGGTLCLASLELWDFPPIWFILDGHALWHLGTSPVAYLWFSFLTDNAMHEFNRNLKHA